MNKKEELYYQPNGTWEMFPDPEATNIHERWWHKFLFWIPRNYQNYKIRREYKELSEILEAQAGKEYEQK